jgi:hypothetical protein
MFETTSRYYSLKNDAYTAPDGREITYKLRRFLPKGADLALLQEVTVLQGDRLDLIAARTLGEAEQFWRISDANDAMNPDDLTDETGRTLRVPIPQF